MRINLRQKISWGAAKTSRSEHLLYKLAESIQGGEHFSLTDFEAEFAEEIKRVAPIIELIPERPVPNTYPTTTQKEERIANGDADKDAKDALEAIEEYA